MAPPGTLELFLRIASFLALNLLVVVSAIRISNRIFPTDDMNVAERLACVVLLSLAQLVLVGSILGAIGSLTYHAMSLALLVIYIVLLLLLGRVDIRASLRSIKSSLVRLDSIGFLAILIPAAVFSGYLIANLVLLPAEWDCLEYHLPMAVNWLQEMSTGAVETRYWFYPGNNELLTAWAFLPFKNDLFVDIQNFPYLLLAASAFYCIGIRTGLDKRLSLLATALLLTVPVMKTQITTNIGDIALCSYFLVGILFIIKFKDGGQRSSIILSGIAIGLVAGTKYSGLLYAAALIVLLYLLRGTKVTLRKSILPAMMVIVFGGCWYIRNYAITGNPFFPIGLDIFGHSIIPSGTGSDFYYGSSIAHNLSRIKTYYYLAQALLLDAGPSALFCLPIAIFFISRGRKNGWNNTILLGVLPIILFLFFIFTPLSAETMPGTLNMIKARHIIRLGFPYLALSCLCAVMLLGSLKRPGRRVIEISLLLIIIIKISALAFAYRDLAPIYLGLLALSVLIVTLNLILSTKRAILGAVECILIVLLLSLAATLLVFYRVSKRPRFYGNYLRDKSNIGRPPFIYSGFYEWLDSSIHHEKIGMIGYQVYPLSGPWLGNQAVQLTKRYESIDDLERMLEEKGFSILVIWRYVTEPYSFPPEDRIAQASLPCIYSDQSVHVYRRRGQDI